MSVDYRELQQLIQTSQFESAIEQAHLLLPEHSDDTELLYLLAVAQRFAKQVSAAITTINTILSIRPTHSRAHQEAGYCYLLQGKSDTAREAFKNATITNPALLSAWLQLQKLDNNTDASTAIQTQINTLKALPKMVLGAMDLMYEGKYAQAESVCRQYLQSDKHNPDAMCILAELGVRTKVYDDALFLLETCCQLHPCFEPAQRLLTELLHTLGQHHRAVSHAQKYYENHPNDSGIGATLASCLIGVGKVEEGVSLYRKLLEQEPNRSGMYVQFGHALKAKGDIDDAIKHYQTAYTLNPGLGDAYWSLANTKTYSFSDTELTAMKAYADSAKGDDISRIQFCFALGKAYEDKANYEQSFQYYQLGNKLKQASVRYDADNQSQLVDLQITHCTESLYKDVGQGNKAGDPIFIVGLPRSGSTLIEQILSSHSQVDATMELHNILGIAMRLRGRMTNDTPAYPANLKDLANDQVKALADKFLRDTQHYRQGAPFFIDKMPNNFMHIGLIKLLLPNAKIIDARRDPMACCFSGYKQLFGEGQDFSYGLTEIGRYYRDYERLMEHWDKVFPDQILRVQHEDVINNLEGQVRTILDYCGLQYEQACVEFHKNTRVVKTPSSEQVRQPIYRSAMTQWLNYKPWLNELIDTLDYYPKK